MLPYAAWPWLALVFGLLIGSFSNVCIHRVPLRQSVVTPRSRCPRCLTMIAGWDNIPVLSYVFLGGRCRVCRGPISMRYPLVEALNGFLYYQLALQNPPGLPAAVRMVFVTALLILSLIDLDHQILPDVITLPGIAAGLAASLLPGAPTPLTAALSAAAGYLAFMLVARAWQMLRGIEALGQGDWKMAAMMGAFLGWQGFMLALFLATLAGALVGGGLILAGRGGRQMKLPFGTFLSLGSIVVLFVGTSAIAWYRDFWHA